MSVKKCPSTQKNKERCTCSHINCVRHGICCECVAYHLGLKELPQCYVKAGM